jgi:hypothetical protein
VPISSDTLFEPMSRRQQERASRFLVKIEAGMQAAAMRFRDSDEDRSSDAAVRLWWTSRLRGRPVAKLIQQARRITQERVSLGSVQHGKPGRREAMPYFFVVLRARPSRFRRRPRSACRATPTSRGIEGIEPENRRLNAVVLAVFAVFAGILLVGQTRRSADA